MKTEKYNYVVKCEGKLKEFTHIDCYVVSSTSPFPLLTMALEMVSMSLKTLDVRHILFSPVE